MSFTTNTTVNSGPLIIRTALDGSYNNTYVLGAYEHPVANNYVLMTSNNGLLVPSRELNLITLQVSNTITGNICRVTTLSTTLVSTPSVSTTYLSSNTISSAIQNSNTINVSTLSTSNLYAPGFILEKGHLQYNALTTIVSSGINYLLNSTDWWGKSICVTNTADNVVMNLPISGTLAPDGTMMRITNAASGKTTNVNNFMNGNRTVAYGESIGVIYYSTINKWAPM